MDAISVDTTVKTSLEPKEVFLVDCFENRRDCLLDDFVLEAQNAQRPV